MATSQVPLRDDFVQAAREALETGKVAASLQELFADGPLRPSALFAPIKDIFRSSLYRKAMATPQFSVAKQLHHGRGVRFSPSGVTVASAAPAARDALRTLAAKTVKAQPVFAGALKIHEFRTYEDSLDCCALPAGKRVHEVCPGMLVRIAGTGFAPSPSANEVLFGDTHACVMAASADSLVVQVPLVGMLTSTDEPRFTLGAVQCMVRTAGGSDSTEIEITDFPSVEPGSFDTAFTRLETVIAKLNGRFSLHAGGLARLAEHDHTGSIATALNLFPAIASGITQRLSGISTSLSMMGQLEEKARRMLDGITTSSGILNDLAAIEGQLDDPLSQVWNGSGIVETICEFEKAALKLVIYTILVFILITVVFIILMLVVAALGMGPLGAAAAAGVFLVWLQYILVPFLAIIELELIVLEVLTVVYAVARALELVGDFIDWLSGAKEGG